MDDDDQKETEVRCVQCELAHTPQALVKTDRPL